MAATQTAEPKTVAPKHKTYVVVADAITVSTGRKPNGRTAYTRVLAGRTVKGLPDAQTIKDFLRLGSIKPVDNAQHLAEIRADLKNGGRKHRLTTRRASLNSGAEDDPVAVPVADVQPVDAPANPGSVDPGNLTLDDLDGE